MKLHTFARPPVPRSVPRDSPPGQRRTACVAALPEQAFHPRLRKGRPKPLAATVVLVPEARRRSPSAAERSGRPASSPGTEGGGHGRRGRADGEALAGARWEAARLSSRPWSRGPPSGWRRGANPSEAGPRRRDAGDDRGEPGSADLGGYGRRPWDQPSAGRREGQRKGTSRRRTLDVYSDRLCCSRDRPGDPLDRPGHASDGPCHDRNRPHPTVSDPLTAVTDPPTTAMAPGTTGTDPVTTAAPPPAPGTGRGTTARGPVTGLTDPVDGGSTPTRRRPSAHHG